MAARRAGCDQLGDIQLLLAAGLWNSSIPLPGSSYLLNKCDPRLMRCRESFMTFIQQKRIQAGVERR